MASGFSQRMALQEIAPAERINPSNSDHVLNMFIDLPLTPVSPEEELIRSRGRYKRNTSSTLEETQLTPVKTPGKSPRKTKTPLKMTPSKTPSVPLRTSPRKRLNLPDVLTLQNSSFISSPSKLKRSPLKKLKLDSQSKLINIEGSLIALSHSQLVDLMKTLLLKHPDIKESVIDEIPTPDLSPLEEKLNALQRNIFLSIPSTRWESNRDSFCYRRTSSHLDVFKKECVEQGKTLIHNEQWVTAIEYVLLAWRFVRTLPDWENPAHNKHKTQCFKALSVICSQSIKRISLQESEMLGLIDRLSNLSDDKEYMSPCLKELKKKLQL